jgi:hypothetical protein
VLWLRFVLDVLRRLRMLVLRR